MNTGTEYVANGLQEAHTIEWYRQQLWLRNFWKDTPIFMYPTDQVIMADLIHRLRPALIIELGTFAGGSALFMADRMQDNELGYVMTIDLYDGAWAENNYRNVQNAGRDGRHLRFRPKHPRIEYVQGSSTDDKIVAYAKRAATESTNGDYEFPVWAIVDSDHSYEHARKELELYAPMVTVGGYLIADDTNWGPPAVAVKDFLAEHPEFEVDHDCERLLIGNRMGGWLRRVG